MDITITDFLPKYPNIDNTQYPVLNPYENAFENVLFHKKEFYENKLSEIEVFPSEKGELTKYQKTIARFLSSHTPYNGLLLVHSMVEKGSAHMVLGNHEYNALTYCTKAKNFLTNSFYTLLVCNKQQLETAKLSNSCSKFFLYG